MTYGYDSNDRLHWEKLDHSDNAKDRYTVYSYQVTDQTGKTVYGNTAGTGTPVSQTTYEYDLQGRMSKTTVVEGGTTTEIETNYDDSGIRVRAVETVNGGTPKVTEYLIDGQNHTGYAQALEEFVDGVLAKTYTLGHDVIAEQSSAQANGDPLTFLYDGHGSTRALLDMLGNVAVADQGTPSTVDDVFQRFAYDAYGVHLTGTHLASAAQALTTLLYSGESFDSRTGLQYLRARYYNPSSGRFNRVDPWSGSSRDPQSLHKYLYAHTNPVDLYDPSGLAIEFDRGRGLLVHALFTAHVLLRPGGGSADTALSTLLEEGPLEAIGAALWRPDAIFKDGPLAGFYELKPASHREDRTKALRTSRQMSRYDRALAPFGIGRGDAERFLEAPAGDWVLAGAMIDPRTFNLYLIQFSAENDLTAFGTDGRGLIYYQFEEMGRLDPQMRRVPSHIKIPENARESIWIRPSLITAPQLAFTPAQQAVIGAVLGAGIAVAVARATLIALVGRI